MSSLLSSTIKNPSFWESGFKKIEWMSQRMPILRSINERYSYEKPFAGKTIAMCIHLEAKTAYMALVLQNGGANISITGCNLLTTQDDCAAALVHKGISVHSWRGATPEEYKQQLLRVLDSNPDQILDDGADLTATLYALRPELAPKLIGISEETTCGIVRFRAMEAQGVLKHPVIAVNNAKMKQMFDNRYGTGQSAMEAIMHTTNQTVCGKNFVVIGYGWCGKGVAMRAKGMGAKVIVCEVDPIPANEAIMDGFEVMPLSAAAPRGDFFVTVTGCNNVIRTSHFLQMKDGAILANAGHFDVEINKNDLISISCEPPRLVRDNTQEYVLNNGRKLYLLGEGRLVNLVASDGHPVEIIDLSFSLQCLAQEYLLHNGKNLPPKLLELPKEIDEKVAQLRLDSIGVKIDKLTSDQIEYLNSWN
ncbi:adenosylhomocysteinase [Pelosinus fermentans]|uniref:adenosylhomocysteinase n=1 Tax=Pelosinus fermentans TaxID=365349 RepID=UPI0002684F8E|nr:adenosylhomocysteinase [Pelosinus fermentans]OAM96297.1 adenosylhomocysteinase [Pelosinus fermentans DSM 17108]SDR38569.1 adenosylhomocysteinase [Pelosinus fermentans]